MFFDQLEPPINSIEKNENLGDTEQCHRHELCDSNGQPYHIMVIGTQECGNVLDNVFIQTIKDKWDNKLCEILNKEYEVLHSVTLLYLNIIIFVWKPISGYINDIDEGWVKTGIGNLFG